jgi:hypothetical protein
MSSSSSILAQAANGRRADALFKAMSSDFLLREQFVTNPSQVLFEFVAGKSLQPERATAINQLIYAVMSNPGLVRWLRQYPAKAGSHQPSAKKFNLEFARAVVKNGAYPVVLALPRSSGAAEEPSGETEREILLPIFFGGITRLLDGETEQSGTGTEVSTNVGTTEMSTGTGGTTEMSTGTQMSTGTGGTEVSGTGTGTGTGTEVSGTGTGTGTEVSGTGTEMSTGTGGTESSFGGFSGIFNSRYAQITLEALALYATQLLSIGALNDAYSA